MRTIFLIAIGLLFSVSFNISAQFLHTEGNLIVDGDGNEETGWVLFYLHVASQGRVAIDTWWMDVAGRLYAAAAICCESTT